MWLYVGMYGVFLIIEAIVEIVFSKKDNANSSLWLPTIFGFSFIGAALESGVCNTDDILSILFIYSILYTIYWLCICVSKGASLPQKIKKQDKE